MTNALFDHIASAHRLPDAEILSGARSFDMDFDAYHDDLHTDPEVEHSHNPITGDVVADVIALLDLNTLVKTEFGREYQGLLSSVKDELEDLLNNNDNLIVKFTSINGDVRVEVNYTGTIPLHYHEARCPDFDTAIRVAVGEAAYVIVGT